MAASDERKPVTVLFADLETQYRVRYRDTDEDVAAYLKGAPVRMLNPKARETAHGANRL